MKKIFLVLIIFIGFLGTTQAIAAEYNTPVNKKQEFTYREDNGVYILRLDKNQEILQSIKQFCLEHNIQSGSISGIGAAKNVTLGYYNIKKHQFEPKMFKGDYEITSILGNISYIDKDMYIHIHMTIANDKLQVYGGHLLNGPISLTGEIFITPTCKINRKIDKKLGIAIFDI